MIQMIENEFRKNRIPIKIIALFLVFVFVVGNPAIFAESTEDTSYLLEANKLEALGLFKGTDIGYELDRAPNRAEAGVMLVRLLGSESEALLENYSHDFTDVPEWADRFVGFMWQNNLTKGVGNNLFAPYETVDARSYLTFILRALGYSDDEGDFSWDDAVEFALEIGLINSREFRELSESEFTRGHMVALSYNALNTRYKDSDITLAAGLADLGAISTKIATEENFYFNRPDWDRYMTYLKSGNFVPYVVGKDYETALIELRKSGADNITIIYKYNDLIIKDDVISQNIPAYMENQKSYDCEIEVSLGPTTLYQLQLQNIVDEKGWSGEVAPYVIAAAKFLIKETVLTRYDVFRRLRENINDIVILDEEASAKMSFGAVYEASSGNLYINRFIMSEELILHEITHAMSYSPDSGKIGFPESGNNTRAVTEAFTHYTAGRIKGETVGNLNYFHTGTEEIAFTGGIYNGEDRNNFVLGTFAPLFTLAGKQQIESMYFLDLNAYSRRVLEFNSLYGEQRWETLWALADRFISDPVVSTSQDGNVMVEAYEDYLDGILECLYIDLDMALDSENKLKVLDNKTNSIKLQFPLNYKDYREKFYELENTIYTALSTFDDDVIFEESGTWILPEFLGGEALKLFNELSILGDAVSIGYEVVNSELGAGKVAGLLYLEFDNPGQQLMPVEPGDKLKLGSLYIIQIPGFINGLDGYVEMRDIVEELSRYQANFEDLGSYIVGKIIEAEGFRFRYKYVFFDDVSPQMDGRIVGQFPETGTAIMPGKTTIIIKIVRKRTY